MEKSLKKFRDSYHELLLSFLWRQWSALGIAGYDTGGDKWYIDPESLLIFTACLGRYESRLFDEVLNWLDENGSFINIQRMKNILKKEEFSGARVISAMAGIMAERGKPKKWESLAEEYVSRDSTENLFFRSNGQPMEMFGAPEPVFEKYGLYRGKIEFRAHTQPISIIKNTGFLFKLRALFGVNARPEILLYLLTHESGHPRLIARETYYAQKTIQDILVEMSRSGLINVRNAGREKRYWLKRDEWYNLLAPGQEEILWINWPLLFSALEKIWLKLNQKTLYKLDSLTQSSELRILMQSVRKQIESSGFGYKISNETFYRGIEYTEVFFLDIRSLLTGKEKESGFSSSVSGKKQT